MEIQRFNSINDEFSLRTVEKDGEPWFIAADVCRVLEIGPEQVRRLDSDEYALFSTQGIEGAKNPQMNVVPAAAHMDAGRFEVKTGEKHGHAFHQTRFTTEGVAWIAKKATKCG